MMELEPLYGCVAALDVHQASITVCVLKGGETEQTQVELRQFGAFKRDRYEMAAWVASHQPQQVVMESTGIYWKSPYAALEKQGVRALVVNARHVKQVPGRKTDIADAQWLATLARSGLLRGSFVPPDIFRSLRLVARQARKLSGMVASEKNRLHKVLTDGGIRLAVVVSDIHGKSGRSMIRGLLKGEKPHQIIQRAGKRLKASQQELLDAVDGELTDDHLFVMEQTLEHIEQLEKTIAEYDARVLEKLEPYRDILQRLHTIPGLDQRGAAALLVEIGDDMSVFGSPDRLASWAGVCPGNHESAGKRQSSKKRKGNPYVRRILCEAAQAAKRTRCGLQQKYQSLVIRRGNKRATFAIAHRLLKTVFVLISRGDYYRDSHVDYEATNVARNAPRWLKMLHKYGYITT